MTADSQIYVLNQKIFSFGGDAWIEDAAGNQVFQVDGKAFSLRRTLGLLDPAGALLYQINASLAHLHLTFEIKRNDQVVATISKAFLTFLGDKFTVNLANGDELDIKGNFLGREFQVTQNGVEVIGVSHSLFNLRDSYGVQVAAGFEPALALAIIVALEQMELESHRRNGQL